MYLTQPLHRMIQRHPGVTAAIDGGGRLDWGELGDRVARFAGALHALGLQPGDRVAMLARNGIHYLEYILGVVWAGGVLNPVNVRWTADEIAWSLADCETRILLVEPEFAPLLPAIRAKAACLSHVLAVGPATIPDVLPQDQWLVPANPVEDRLRRADDLAAILYTGGTTGRPKGVMLSHANLAWSVFGAMAEPGCQSGAVILHAAPLFHIGALSGLLTALQAGATSVFVPGFEPRAVLAAVASHRVEDLFLVPTMLRMILDHPDFPSYDTASIRLLRYGAAPIDDALLDRATAAFPGARFLQAYGMTELSPICCLLPPAEHAPAARAEGRGRTAGRATRVCEVRVVDERDRELPRGTVGEIVVRGPTVMHGYWGRPEETAQALRGGWMHTGDLGRMDDDGFVTVVDRLKDMIISGGENVYSAEVENALATCPGVAAAAVIGLPDERWGERVHAVIVPRRGPPPTSAAIEAHCRERLAGFRMPRSIEFVDALPMSPAGKVLKTELRRRHRTPAIEDTGPVQTPTRKGGQTRQAPA